MHVAVHEFGHSLGLGHSSVEDSIMFPWYHDNGYKPNKEMPEDDRMAIQQIYGTREKQWGVINTKPRQREHTTTTTTTTRTTTLRAFYPDRPKVTDRNDWQTRKRAQHEREQIEKERRLREQRDRELERERFLERERQRQAVSLITLYLHERCTS